MEHKSIGYATEPITPCETFRRNGRKRIQGLRIKKGKYKGCKIIDDDLRLRGDHYVVIEYGKTTAPKMLFREALKLV